MKLFQRYTCTVCEIGLFTEEEEDDVEQIRVLAMLRNTEGRWNRFGRSGGCRTNNKQLRTRLPGSALFVRYVNTNFCLTNRNLLPLPSVPCVIVVHLCGSVNSELRTIYIMLLVCHSRRDPDLCVSGLEATALARTKVGMTPVIQSSRVSRKCTRAHSLPSARMRSVV